MKQSRSSIAALLRYGWIALLPLLLLCRQSDSQKTHKVPQRIVSLAPSITETLFALGLGDRVVGVTRYCKNPPEASGKEKVGGYSDANLEKIVSLQPDLVICSPEHEKQRHYLAQFSIPVLSVRNGNVAQVCSTFAVIGRRCSAMHNADSLISVFSTVMNAQPENGMEDRPSVLVCVGRDTPGGGTVRTLFVAGEGTFYNDLIIAAGGHNAFTGNRQMFPKISLEGLLAARPDIVIDIAPAMDDLPCERMVEDWASVSRIPAVRNGHIYCIAESYGTVPGPRLLFLLADLKKIIAAAQGDVAS